MVEELFQNDFQGLNVILIALMVLAIMAGAVVLFFIFSRKRVVNAELEQANQRILHQKELLQATIVTQEEERQRIAQDLHDAISSKLNIVSLHANMLSDAGIASEEANSIGAQIVSITGTVLESSRKIAHDLLPPTLSKFGLEAALEELFDEVSETKKFELKYTLEYSEETLPPEEELHIFRMVQELFNNTIKYAEAHTVLVKLTTTSEGLIFKYQDDGKGFALQEGSTKKGLGLSGLQQRADLLNASVTMTASEGQGFSLELHKPLS
ncbi:MAG: two-component sensor histidine kinase [Flavobacteriaceae bacterium]|nr:two-component sensor histidine kinase [Flavobacteriaceae bacterium]|tara:strand:+ start:24000 stop:24803 length:804 start_codon:yes stop_codon:yes gene_type:complete